ncbi:MAG: protease SohB [Proteobacteria bacterium]|nr:protease SohB [Pseudomonadota bacterium]
MAEILIEYGLFLAKAVTITVSALFLIGGIISLLFKDKAEKKDQIQILNLNEKYLKYSQIFERQTLPKHELKQRIKEEKAKRKESKKKEKKSLEHKKRLFLLNFNGDIRASAVDALSEEITAVLTVATPQDEVLLRLESGGGMVHSYGLAASQLMRLRQKRVPLTIAVDKIAASGGYMMACVADRIIAAPFAVLGSIGVVAQIPNFHRLLKRHDVDFEQITAGKHKRTLTLFGENTDAEREKMKQELEDTHTLFKDFVLNSRKELDIEKIATGEHWYGSQALELNLVDSLTTSDDYLLSESERADLFEVTYVIKKSFLERFPMAVRNAMRQ